MKKYKAIVKYKVTIDDVQEFESDGANAQEVTRDIKRQVEAETEGFATSGLFSSDEVYIDFEIADVTPTGED